MDIKTLLDKFEILYPHNQDLSDFRRAYVDKDLSSIFRIVTDQNKDDIRKVVMEHNEWSMYKLLSQYIDTSFVQTFKRLLSENISIDEDCFSRGQLQSKKWLIDELKKIDGRTSDLKFGTIFLCAGWYGTLATMLFENDFDIKKIRSFDIDENCQKIAEIFNKIWITDDWKFKAITEDMHNINYKRHTWSCWSNANNRMSHPVTEEPDTIINTSCEHIENFAEWYAKIPQGKLVILQTNNYFDLPEHVNCSDSLNTFANSTPITNVLYQGELALEKYSRYMRIGYK
jgi:hypothetical protein